MEIPLAIFLGMALLLGFVAVMLYVEIVAARDNVRADIAAQSAMQQRRYDDLVGLCESIEAREAKRG